MSKLRNAASIALDVLESMEQNYGELWSVNRTAEGIDALCNTLREALMAEPTPVTGWTDGLSQDYNKKLANWFMSKPGSMQELRDQFEASEPQVTHKITHNNTAVVSTVISWIPIDDITPQGVKCLVIDKTQGIAYLREYWPGHGWTHWSPLPRFSV